MRVRRRRKAPAELSGSQVKDRKQINDCTQETAQRLSTPAYTRKRLFTGLHLLTPHPKTGSGTKERVTKERVSVRVETLECMSK
jgi:hypothetical protein